MHLVNSKKRLYNVFKEGDEKHDQTIYFILQAACMAFCFGYDMRGACCRVRSFLRRNCKADYKQIRAEQKFKADNYMGDRASCNLSAQVSV